MDDALKIADCRLGGKGNIAARNIKKGEAMKILVNYRLGLQADQE